MGAYSQFPDIPDLEYPPPTLAEIKNQIMKLQKNKSPGGDGIQAEIIQAGGEGLHKKIHQLIKGIWILEDIPEDWKTAVICLTHMFSTWAVSLGGIRRSGSESGRVTINTRSTTVHSGYNANTLNNDIAVIFLGTNVQLNSYIALVNLPSRSQAGNSFEGQTATVSGWGLTADNGNTASTLQYTTLSVISNSLCQQYYGGVIVSSTLCAIGSNRQSTCNGDSGGPMVIGSTDSFTLIGVVSFVSDAGCSSGAPSGYARVISFLDWISSTAGVSIS
ncbi:collagenase-like [Schistocerca serialis cubense]|uniref:collagenase-like n=1 Tax=Schistocerca serialis cubense TaxID=2023355 RepID=UPI00214E7B10|nr:collagenase-like [Schistocerca serialis cubense]